MTEPPAYIFGLPADTPDGARLMEAYSSSDGDYASVAAEYGRVLEDRITARKVAATLHMPAELLADYQEWAAFIDDALRRALSGEPGVFREPEPPRRHRCLFCWLLAKLPRHEPCGHGRLACDDCWDDYS